MIINKLRVENFKSFYDPIEIDFNQVQGLWKIQGPVGTGKTSIGEAILYGLFGTVNGKNNGDLISWGRKHGVVELWCTSQGRSLYIKRNINAYGQSPTYVEIDGEEMISTNKRDIQTQLESEYYDISRLTIELLCIISFNNFKSLTSLNTSDSKKFMDSILGFYIISQYCDACKTFRTENKTKMNSLSNEIHKLQGQIDKIRQLSNIEVIDGNKEEVKAELKRLKEQLTKLTNTYRSDYKDINDIVLEKKQNQSVIKSLGVTKANEIKFIEQGICPTCGAPIDQSQLDTKKREREVLLKQYKDIEESIKPLQEKLAGLTSKYDKDQSDINNLIHTNTSLLTKLEEQSKRINVNLQEISTIEGEIDVVSGQLTELNKEDQEWALLTDILSNDIKSKILESFIPLLNKHIQKYTSELQLPYIVTYDSAFKCSIHKYKVDQPIPISNLSTGQAKSVNMCVILGMLSTVIGSSNINVLFLDELMGNMDPELANDACRVLRANIKPGNTIFIISHVTTDDKYYNGAIQLGLSKQNYEDRSIIKVINYDV